VSYGLMVDSSVDARTIFDAVVAGLGGKPDVWARYLGTGGAGVTPLTADEARFLLSHGISILPVYNDSRLNGGTPGTADQGAFEAEELLQQAAAAGVPDGVYVAVDLEYGCPVTSSYLTALCGAIRASRLAGSGILYGNTTQAYFTAAYHPALADANVQRALLWCAAWIDPPPGGWTLQDLPGWRCPDASAAVVAWQFTDKGPGGTDLSLVRLPLPTPGGLWVPTAADLAPPPAPSAPEPQAAPPPDPIADAIQKLQEAEADLERAKSGGAT
jgi:hypothetical protein